MSRCQRVDKMETKEKIQALLGNQLRFEGHFDKCFEQLKDTQQQDLFSWIINCKENKENVIQSKRDRALIGFVKRFGSNVRAVLTKQKEGHFIALFLDKHKYYDEEMEKLGF